MVSCCSMLAELASQDGAAADGWLVLACDGQACMNGCTAEDCLKHSNVRFKEHFLEINHRI